MGALVVSLSLVLLHGAVALGAAHPEPTDPPPSPAPSTRLAGHWTKIPQAPWGTGLPAAVAIDGAMLVLDLDTGRVLRYDPESRTWKRRARAPQPFDAITPWAWSGEELVVFDSLKPDRVFAYDLKKDAWRRLPGSPLPRHHFAVWAGRRIVAVYAEQDNDEDIERRMAMLDPDTGTWTELPPPQGRNKLIDLVWTGSTILAVTTNEYLNTVQVESLDLDTGTWSVPLAGPVYSYWADPVWAGDRLVWSGDETFVGRADASFDPATMTWTAEDFDCPLYSGAALWTGELLVGTNYNYALDPTTGDCYRVPGRDRTMGGSAAALWTGDRVIYWSGGGAEEGQPSPYRRGGHAFVVDGARP